MPTSEWSAITGKKSEAPTVKSDISMPRSALERELSQAEEHVVKDPDRIAHHLAFDELLYPSEVQEVAADATKRWEDARRCARAASGKTT